MKSLFYEQLLYSSQKNRTRQSQLWDKAESNDVPFEYYISLSISHHYISLYVYLTSVTSVYYSKRKTAASWTGPAMHWLSFYFGNFRETWTRNFNPRDALFLLFNFRDSCVGPPFLNLQSFKVWKTLTGSGHIATAIFLTSNRFNLIVTMT